ncbi:MAG: hypothetical protein O3C54_05500 [Proteobacteria bacterium]|jgi:hypothetical protein|nr:hypothetical protein [Pseudomonadota bacterium]
MVKVFALVASALLISGCVSPINEYNYLAGPNKAMAVAVNAYGQKTGGAGWASGQTIAQARANALNNCYKYNRNATCIIERVNNSFVINESLAELNNARIAQQQQQYQNYINQKQSLCRSYGYSSQDAIAMCVQQEINNERSRLYAQQAQANAQAQADHQRRMNALSNYGRCLGTEGETFGSCANAWQGYTPPKKTVTQCRYDTFGNIINGTCTSRTQ